MMYEEFFPELAGEQIDQLHKLKELYSEWNNKINVVSRKDIDNLDERHVLHSLAIAKFTNFKAGTKIMDLGTGGGFPGIPLAIIFPEVSFDLVDSRNKKLTVINEVAQAIGLQNVQTIHSRAEELKSQYHYVLSRAVASLDKLVSWSNSLIMEQQINALPNGLICLKGGDLKKEIKSLPKDYDVEKVALREYFNTAFFEEKFLLYVPL